jgi:hypothetical protein
MVANGAGVFPSGFFPPVQGGFAGTDLAALYDLLFQNFVSAELELEDLSKPNRYQPFIDVYGKGNCFVYQSMVTSPVKEGLINEATGEREWIPYEFSQVDKIRDAMQAANDASGTLGLEGNLYLNVGLQSNYAFYDNSFEFKWKYPQLGYQGSQILQIRQGFNYLENLFGGITPPLFVPGAQLILADRQVYELFLLSGAGPVCFPGGPPCMPYWYQPILDCTRSQVVRLGLEDIRNNVRKYGFRGLRLRGNFIIGGEFQLDHYAPAPTGLIAPRFGVACTQPITSESECRNCQPFTPYSDELDKAFQAYLEEMLGLDLAGVNIRWGLPVINSMTGQVVIPEFAGVGLENIVPSLEDWCNYRGSGYGLYQGVLDYRAFLRHLTRELYLIQYTEAKKTAPFGRHGARGPDPESTWLQSDMSLTGAWYNHQVESETSELAYYSNSKLGRTLYYWANMARLGGRPIGFPITSPPTTEKIGANSVRVIPPVGWSTSPVSIQFQPRAITRQHYFFFYRDILSAGVCGFGYYKLYGFSLFCGDPPDALIEEYQGSIINNRYSYDGAAICNEILEEFKLIVQPRYLRFMTPYQRMAVHLDAYQMETFQVEPLRLAAKLLEHLDERHLPYAMMSDPRVFERLFARSTLGKSLVIVPFHSDLDLTLMSKYVSIVGSGGIAMVITDQATYASKLGSGGAMSELITGTNWLKVLWDPANPRVFLYVTQIQATPQMPPEKQLTLCDLNYLESEIEGFSAQVSARLIDVTIPAQPGPVATAADMKSTVVSDGMNYVVAISNLNQMDPVNCILTLPPERRVNGYDYYAMQITSSELTAPLAPIEENGREQALTGSNTPSGFQVSLSLAPRETKFIYLGVAAGAFGDPTAISAEIAGEIGSIKSALRGVLPGASPPFYSPSPPEVSRYDTEAGVRALDYIADILAPTSPLLAPAIPLERSIAGLVQLSNMVFLDVDRFGGTLALSAVRLNLDNYGMPVPADGEVQILHLLNGQEEQDAGVTASGTARATIAATTYKHWDFGALDPAGATTPKYVTNLGGLPPDLSPVEVHVLDPVLGTATFVTVTADVVLPGAGELGVIQETGVGVRGGGNV